MKNNNNMLMTIVVAVIVALITSLVTAIVMRNSDVGLAPTLTKDNIALPIRANSCDADGVCEVNSLMTHSDVSAQKISVNQLVANSATNQIILNSSLYSYGFAVFNADLRVTSPYKIQANRASIAHVVVTEDLAVEQPPTVWTMTGNGNGYVCVNAFGKFYRNSVPCT